MLWSIRISTSSDFLTYPQRCYFLLQRTAKR